MPLELLPKNQSLMLSETGFSFSTVFLEKARKSIFNTYLTGAVAVAPWKERAREKMPGTMTAAAPPRPESRTERKWTVLQQPYCCEKHVGCVCEAVRRGLPREVSTA